jgi:hypothetical protein
MKPPPPPILPDKLAAYIESQIAYLTPHHLNLLYILKFCLAKLFENTSDETQDGYHGEEYLVNEK